MKRCALWVLVACVAGCGGSPPTAPTHGAHAEATSDAPQASPTATAEGTTATEPGPSRQQREQRVIELLEGKVGEDQLPESAR